MIDLSLAVLTALAAAVPVQTESPTATTLRFEKDVLPILTRHCIKCHGAAKPKAGLDLRSRASILRGGEAGPALVPGSSGKSLLLEMVRKGDMPPKGEKLTPQQVAILRVWIDGGAPSAEGAPVSDIFVRKITDQDRKFWAFQKPVRPAVPHVRNAGRALSPIDAFILAKL